MTIATRVRIFFKTFNEPSLDADRNVRIVMITALAFVSATMFLDILLSGKIVSLKATDIFYQFYYFRKFGFEQLRHGIIALWNPHIFSGTPFFATFQPALLYPPNVIHLVFPVEQSITIEVMFHIFLIGMLMYLWTSHRRLHPLACLLASFAVMFGGPVFLRVYAGHLPNLATMAWAPLLFLSIDGYRETRAFHWIFWGIFSVSMQILAGHPQYVYYTAITAIIYLMFNGIKEDRVIRVTSGIFLVYIAAILLTAVQLLPGIVLNSETVRGQPLAFSVASSYSFPPENMITFLVPYFFGNGIDIKYWGRSLFWETSAYLSVTVFFLAIAGALWAEKRIRKFSVWMVVVLMLLALGVHTPLYHVFYAIVPFFGRFRGTSKFIFFASLFIAMLSAAGLDRILREKQHSLTMAVLALGSAILLAGASAFFSLSSFQSLATGLWKNFFDFLQNTKEVWLDKALARSPEFMISSFSFAAHSLMISALTTLLLSVLFFGRTKWQYAAHGIFLLAFLELGSFAFLNRPSFNSSEVRWPGLQEVLSRVSGDYRFADRSNSNVSMAIDGNNILGYDSNVLRRYGEFMFFTQGLDPNVATYSLKMRGYHALYSMLRCRYVIDIAENKQTKILLEHKKTMAVCNLIHEYKIIPGRDDIFTKMNKPEFDPAKTVILEKEPGIQMTLPAVGESVKVIDSSPDSMTIEARLTSPGILLVTDSYAKGWRARPLIKTIQGSYQIMPADYILRAVPLREGYHKFILEYRPPEFRLGIWISIVSVILLFGFITAQQIISRRNLAKTLLPRAPLEGSLP